MYVTRPLSVYRIAPEALTLPPPEGTNSGYLVTYEGSDHEQNIITDLPLPQDKFVSVENEDTSSSSIPTKVLFIPVINQPLSSNRYYVIAADGKNQGLAYENSTEDESETTCFCSSYLPDKRPRILNPYDPKQQFIIKRSSQRPRFTTSTSADRVPPKFLRHLWKISPTYTSFSNPEPLIPREEAWGLNSVLRTQLPDFNFPLSQVTSDPVVVGKWYCPFMFIRELTPMYQFQQQSVYYVMTLEQIWERIYTHENGEGGGGMTDSVAPNVVVQTEVVKVNGLEAVAERDEESRVVSYWSLTQNTEEHMRVGLSFAIWERMVAEEVRVGWVDWPGKQQMVGRVENFYGAHVGHVPTDDPYDYYYSSATFSPLSWRKYGFYVLVERFVLRRMNGSLVLTAEFKHTHQVRSKWEL